MDTMTIVIIVGAVLALGIAGYFLFRWYQKEKKAIAEAVFHFRCTGCKRRLRYCARQVGNKAKCSNCGKDIVFPPTSMSVE